MLKRIIYQVLTAVACSLGAMCLGMLFVWPSYTLPMLASSNSTILTSRLSATEEAMLGSLPSLGAAVGSALVGMLMDSVGRKMSSLLMTVLFVLSWGTIGATTSITVVLVARFVGGLAGGATMVINPVYVAETSEDNIRGALASGVVTFFGTGTLISYFIGWYCSYHTIAWIHLSIAVARGLLLLCVPESPVFLMKKKRPEEARISMSIYRGTNPNSLIVQEEISKIKQHLYSHLPADSLKEVDDPEMTKLTSEEMKEQPRKKFVALRTLCTSPASRRAFSILFVAFTMETAMGLAPVQVYAKQVFIDTDPSRSDLYSVILALFWCGGAFLCSGVADKLGRRVMLITSACTAATCMFVIGLLIQTQVAPPWVTVIFIMLFCFCFQSGSGCVPYILLCEMLCPEYIARKGGTVLIFDGHQYYKNSSYKDGSLLWRCRSYKKLKCKGFITVHFSYFQRVVVVALGSTFLARLKRVPLASWLAGRPLLLYVVLRTSLNSLGVLIKSEVAPPWVTVVFIMLFCFYFQSGSGCVPYILLCEMLCPEVQTLASMLIVEWLWVTAFVILALFNWLRRLIGIHVIFYIFSLNGFLYATFSYCLLPETKGLSNKEIQLALLRGRRK